MNLPAASSSEHHHVVLDTNIFRKHIGGSWEFPEALGAMAHRGEVTIHVPWIVDREFVSSIPEHVGELLDREARMHALARMAQASSSPQQLETLRAELDRSLAASVDEMTARYEQWKKTAHVVIGEEPAAFSNEVFALYFAGDPPFERPRQREHLPDAFIYVEIQRLAARFRRISFVSDDERLRTCAAALPGVGVFKRLFDVLKRRPLPTTERHALIGHLAGRAAAARRLVEQDLSGLRLVFRDQPYSIGAVHEIEEVEMDRAGFVRLENDLHLTVWRCTAVLDIDPELDAHAGLDVSILQSPAALRSFRVRCKLEVQLMMFAVDATSAAMREELDVFECKEIEVLEERPFEERHARVADVEPRVAALDRQRLERTLSTIRDGLIIVGGSRASIRREVASYVARAYLQFHPGLCIATFPETPARHSFLTPPPYKPYGHDLVEWIERDVHLRFKPAALVIDQEYPGVLTDVIDALPVGMLVIATVANASGATDLIRRVHQETPKSYVPFAQLRAVCFIKKRRWRQPVEFSFETGSCWGDGTWHAVVKRDEWLHPRPDNERF